MPIANPLAFAEPEACLVTRMALPFSSTPGAGHRPCHQLLSTVPQASISERAYHVTKPARWIATGSLRYSPY